MGTVRHWLNLETFILCLDDVSVIKKVNLRRLVPEGDSGATSSDTIPGLEIHLKGGIEGIEIDYLKADHRDQVYNAIWVEIGKMGGQS